MLTVFDEFQPFPTGLCRVWSACFHVVSTVFGRVRRFSTAFNRAHPCSTFFDGFGRFSTVDGRRRRFSTFVNGFQQFFVVFDVCFQRFSTMLNRCPCCFVVCVRHFFTSFRQCSAVFDGVRQSSTVFMCFRLCSSVVDGVQPLS